MSLQNFLWIFQSFDWQSRQQYQIDLQEEQRLRS